MVNRICESCRKNSEGQHEKNMRGNAAEHAYYSHIHDEVTVYDAFPATIHKKLMKMKVSQKTQQHRKMKQNSPLSEALKDTEADFEDS